MSERRYVAFLGGSSFAVMGQHYPEADGDFEYCIAMDKDHALKEWGNDPKVDVCELVPAELMDAFRKANSEYCSGHHSWCDYKVFRDTCHCGYAEIEALL